jgi:hypothetical protein
MNIVKLSLYAALDAVYSPGDPEPSQEGNPSPPLHPLPSPQPPQLAEVGTLVFHAHDVVIDPPSPVVGGAYITVALLFEQPPPHVAWAVKVAW